jgi:hypothetical protein
MPAPTSWPLIAAFGIALAFAGLLTHVLVSLVGIVLLAAASVGWWREVLPEERVEHMLLRPPEERAVPVMAVPEAVTQLEVGRELHRLRIPVEIHPYSAGIRGGIIGGVAMAAVAMLFGVISHGSVWYPINLLAAAALPSLAQASTAQLASFNGVALLVAIAVHVVMSLFVGLLYGVTLPMLPRFPVLWGGVVAPLVWTGVVWASLGIVNPTLDQRVEWSWFVGSQIAFGLAAGFVVSRSERVRTLQSWPLAARAGLEIPGLKRGKEEPRQ